MGELERVVVVGASLAGLRACETLRSNGFAGTVTLIGAESQLPYDRPPLSKKLLTGEWEPDRIALRKPESIDELGLDLRLGVPAAGVETSSDGGTVHLADGTVAPYDGLIIATGAACRRLPGQPDLAGIFELRTLDDSLSLRAATAEPGTQVVVIGAGFIGLEVAASLRERGCEVTVLEGAPAPLIRGLGPEMGANVAMVHGEHGIDLRCGVQVVGIEGAGGRVGGVRLGDGSLVSASVVVVGIGVAPATGWLADAGLELGDGIVCDATMRSVRGGNVYAAGDCARWPHQLFDAEVRIEHWTNASEQGAVAATNLLRTAAGEDAEGYAGVPFFWSDQFDRRIQFLGRAFGPGEDPEAYDIRLVHGSPEKGKFVALYGVGGRFRGALGVSLPKLVMPYRALVARGATWDEALEFAAGQTPPNL